jgi:hypothetical protein
VVDPGTAGWPRVRREWRASRCIARTFEYEMRPPANASVMAGSPDSATDSKWDWVAEHTRAYLASGGTEGHESNGVYTLVLATTGRITGEPRRTGLIYGTAGNDLLRRRGLQGRR